MRPFASLLERKGQFPPLPPFNHGRLLRDLGMLAGVGLSRLKAQRCWRRFGQCGSKDGNNVCI